MLGCQPVDDDDDLNDGDGYDDDRKRLVNRWTMSGRWVGENDDEEK